MFVDHTTPNYGVKQPITRDGHKGVILDVQLMEIVSDVTKADQLANYAIIAKITRNSESIDITARPKMNTDA